MTFYVIETQTNETGAVIPYSFNNREDAEEKYHDILRGACKSKVKKHGCMIINADMIIQKAEVYDHEEVTE